MKIVRLFFLFILLSAQQVLADDEWHVGMCGAMNLSAVKTNNDNIFNLPVYRGGISFMYGLHVNYRFLKVLDLELGVNKVSKGFSYETIGSNNLPSVQYTTLHTITAPLTFYLNIPLGITRFAVGSGIAYSYGYQSQEIDHEWLEGAVSFEYRIQDVRLGRFLSIDPLTKKYPQYSPYHFSSNQPIHTNELEGLESGADLNVSANVSITYTFGTNGGSNLNVGAGASVTGTASIGSFSGQLGLSVSGNYTNGGITSFFGQQTGLTKGNAEIIMSPSLILGGGGGIPPLNTNYLHGNATTSLNNPIPYSGLYALNFHCGAAGTNQRTATYGLRVGNVSLNVLEDHALWMGADKEDRWWTGSGNLNLQLNDGTVFTAGTDTYTGNSENSFSTPEQLGDTEIGGTVGSGKNEGQNFYWANQTQIDNLMGLPAGYNQALNNAQTCKSSA